MARQAEAEWKGDLKGGSGHVKLGSGAFEGDYSFASRFESGAGANPEELLGAAHAGCYLHGARQLARHGRLHRHERAHHRRRAPRQGRQGLSDQPDRADRERRGARTSTTPRSRSTSRRPRSAASSRARSRPTRSPSKRRSSRGRVFRPGLSAHEDGSPDPLERRRRPRAAAAARGPWLRRRL